MDEWISKKDLLEETGITYGQLYRWKREGLIPESWFVKRSARTGQETFLPRGKILDRIRFIQENRQGHSLLKVHALLDPAAADRIFEPQMLMQVPNTLTPMTVLTDITGRNLLTRAEAMMVLLAARAAKQYSSMTESDMTVFIRCMLAWEMEYGFTTASEGCVQLFKIKQSAVPVFVPRDCEAVSGGDVRMVFRMNTSEMQSQFLPVLMNLDEE